MMISDAPPAARWHVLASNVWSHGSAPVRSVPCCASMPRGLPAMGVTASLLELCGLLALDMTASTIHAGRTTDCCWA